jgi:hypothetical protein
MALLVNKNLEKQLGRSVLDVVVLAGHFLRCGCTAYYVSTRLL